MRVAVIGAGAIGGFYGLMLARAGHDVHFVMRSDYETVRRDGLTLRSPLGDYDLMPVQVYRDARDLPPCDLFLIATKTTSNAELAPTIGALAAPGSIVLVLQNGFGVEAAFRAHLHPEVHLLGGLCIISVHRQRAGVIEHHGLGSINVGYHSGPAHSAGDHFVSETIQRPFDLAGVEVSVMPDLETARWQKLVMNVPFSGLTVLLNAGTQALMRDESSRGLVWQIMNEVAQAAAACGHPLPDGYLDKAWATTDGQPDYMSSMHLDYQQKRPLELGAIYQAPLEAAEAVGCPMPAVAMLHRTLCFLDRRNRTGA